MILHLYCPEGNNFYGEYDFSEEKLKNSTGSDLPGIVGGKKRKKNGNKLLLYNQLTQLIIKNPMKHFYPLDTINLDFKQWIY